MNRYRVLIQPRADADTLEAFYWLVERSPAAAERWLSGLEKAVAKLALNPERHPLAIEESERFGLSIRQCLYGKRRGTYRILFHIVGDELHVLAIRHSAQDTMTP